MSAERKQSGLAHSYTEWVPETTVGEVPADPQFRPFSDNMRTVWDGEPDASTEAQRGLGTRDPRDFYNGPEEHEFTFVYDLQQWYVDSNGDTLDPAGDIVKDTPDNDVGATHTVVSKETHSSGGADGGGRYIYTVGVGGHLSELTVPFETEDGLPVPQELVYRFEKVREYDVSQPANTGKLGVRSTSDADTTQTVQLESDDGSTSEGVSLDGTTFAETTGEFDSLAAAQLDNETEGDIIISTSDGAAEPGADTDLMTIYGNESYGGVEGDTGVPAIGSGSHASSVGNDYIRFRQDKIQYTGGVEIAPEISSGELSLDNGIEGAGQAHTVRQSIDVGQRETTLTASLAGPKVSFDQMVEYVTEEATTIEWVPNIDGDHKLELVNARLMTPGSIARETDAAKLMVESEWQSEGMNIS